MDNYFGVCVRRKDVSLRLQPFAQFYKIVNFSVIHDPDVSIFVRDGLFSSIQVNNRQAPVTQYDLPTIIDPVIIRTPMDNSVHHLTDDTGINAPLLLPSDFSADSTHCLRSQSFSPVFKANGPTEHF